MVAPAVIAIVPTIVDWIGKAVTKAIPDPDKAAEVMLEVRRMEQAGELATLSVETDIAKAQAQINEIEAASDSKFKSWWRPALGWVCVFGLGYQFLIRPLVILALVVANVQADYSVFDLDVATLATILFGMLGLGYYRTIEKKSGVA